MADRIPVYQKPVVTPRVPYRPSSGVQGGGRAELIKRLNVQSAQRRKKVFDQAEGVVPFVSNIANSLRRMPRPKVPMPTGYVRPATISANVQLNEVDRSVRGANVGADQGLDANTAAAVKAANMVTGIRGRNQVFESVNNHNSAAQAQASQINANIEAMNNQQFNYYQQQQLEGQLAQQRNNAANVANAADKFVLAKNQKAAHQLDLDKWKVLSKVFDNSGVADRLLTTLEKDGLSINAYGGELGGGGGEKPAVPTRGKYRDDYYEANARLLHYKGLLNEKLRAKNPKAFQEYFQQMMPIRMKNDEKARLDYIENSQYNDYLSPAEVQQTLGDEYEPYLKSLQAVNTYNVEQGKQPLWGQIEGEKDVRALNYGRRFASLEVTPSIDVTIGDKRYKRSYKYEPGKGVDFTEEGDPGIRPTYLKAPAPIVAKKRFGGTLKSVY